MLAGGGNTVAIAGTFTSAAPTVDFGSKAATVSSHTTTLIEAVAPSGTGPQLVEVKDGLSGHSPTSPTSFFDYDYGPTVTEVSPDSGGTDGGEVVTVSGGNFVAGSTTVVFGTSAGTNVTVSSPTSLTVTSPAQSAGLVDIVVTTPGGSSPTSVADEYQYYATPQVISVSPDLGPSTGGTSTIISGSGFASGATVDFGHGQPGDSGRGRQLGRDHG